MTLRRATALALLCAGCTTPLATGEQRYREGDRLGALETWRAIPETDPSWERASARIAVVESEFQQLVERYKKRGQYFEEKGRLAESILDYRLALKLQPSDAPTLDHVQHLARELQQRKAQQMRTYESAFAAHDLPAARDGLRELRALDPFDPHLESEERKLHAALRSAVGRRLAEGRRGFTAGDHVSAERAFRRVLELDPQNESARGYLSYMETMERESSDPEKQPRPFVPRVRFASDAEIRAEGFYQNALAAEREGDRFLAIRHALRALEADPEHAAARTKLAELRRRMAPEVDVLIEAGRRSFRNEDLHSALDQWRRASLIDPDNERARAYIARAERQIENLERLRSEPDVSADAD